MKQIGRGYLCTITVLRLVDVPHTIKVSLGADEKHTVGDSVGSQRALAEGIPRQLVKRFARCQHDTCAFLVLQVNPSVGQGWYGGSPRTPRQPLAVM